jgi:acetyl-CoA carboxylase carboxyl transferase subunit alpha
MAAEVPGPGGLSEKESRQAIGILFLIVCVDLIGFGIVDRIIPEPSGGAHSDPKAAIKSVGDAVEEELKALLKLAPDGILRQRADRFYAIGRKGVG